MNSYKIIFSLIAIASLSQVTCISEQDFLNAQLNRLKAEEKQLQLEKNNFNNTKTGTGFLIGETALACLAGYKLPDYFLSQGLLLRNKVSTRTPLPKRSMFALVALLGTAIAHGAARYKYIQDYEQQVQENKLEQAALRQNLEQPDPTHN